MSEAKKAENQSEEEDMSSAKKLKIARGKEKELVTKQGSPERQRNRTDPMTSKEASEYEEPEKASISLSIRENTWDNDISFLELQEANNILKAAYKELMTIAVEADTWVLATPALGSLEEFLQIFWSPPAPGMIVERSVESEIIPIDMDTLISYMVDTDNWASLMSNMVHLGSIHTPVNCLNQLSSIDGAIKHICMVNAEFQLPTSFVQTRKFKFVRCVREIMPDILAVVDLSDDYFPHGSDCQPKQNCRRRPSGLIVRRHGYFSEVIWIENVEVHDCTLEDNIYSGIIKSNVPFSAKHFLSTLKWKLKRKESRFIHVKMQLCREAGVVFNQLTHFMKMLYKDIVHETPDERKWVIISNRGVRILRNLILDQCNPGSKYYIGVTSFRVQAKPLSVFGYLVDKNIELEWPSELNDGGGPEEVMELASYDDSNSITLHQNTVLSVSGNQVSEYLLQEASKDGLRYFVISSPVTEVGFNSACFFGRSDGVMLMPSGFAILPDGFDSNSSLVTIVMHVECPYPETDNAIEFVSSEVWSTIGEIYGAVGVVEAKSAKPNFKLTDLKKFEDDSL